MNSFDKNNTKLHIVRILSMTTDSENLRCLRLADEF